jgi:hypothetical protein
MAKPIKETPYLYGKDAIQFIKENKTVAKISDKEKREIQESFNALKSIAQFEI